MIRIALIGCTDATSDYGEVVSRLQGARFAAVVDPDGTLAGRTAETLDVPLRATSFDDLLRDNANAFDAVVIHGPCGSPQAVVARAEAAGKHVLLDMRLLLQFPPGYASIEACRSAGVTFMLSQPTRFLPSVAEVKNCLRSDVLGTPGLLRIHHWSPPDMNEQADATAAIFGALLPDIDLTNWIFGPLPNEVYATGHAVAASCGYVQVHLGYANGGMALVDRSTMLPPGSDYFSLSVVGSNGAAYADDHHNMHLQYRGGRPTALPGGQGSLHHVAELQAFVDAIEMGCPPAITDSDGHKAVEVARAAERSLQSGRVMRLNGGCYELV